jgi:hypothetical protein
VPICALLTAAANAPLRSLENAAQSNKPLMVSTRDWKSAPVLPMFRTHPLAFDPGVFPAMRA